MASDPPAADRELEDLRTDLERKTREMRIIQLIASNIISTLDLDRILETILETMEEVLAFRHSMILLLDGEGAGLEVVASRGYPQTGLQARVPVGKGIIGVVARRKKVMRMNNIGYQRRYLSAVTGNARQTVPLPGLEDCQSQIAIPLLVKDRLIGVLSVESARANAFDPLDETLLGILGNQTAAAIDNARAYQIAEARLDELDKANEALNRLNEGLEERVEQRTAELSATLAQLTEAQDQLILREKMASLGKLVAGLTHELNNPAGILLSAADVAKRCIARLESSPDERALTLLKNNLKTVLAAGGRIAAVVKSLKDFAHLDQAERQRVDLARGIDSVLVLLENQLQNRIDVQREYGDIPPLLCAPGQLNQVFMHLLTNAIQAIDDRGTITIRTSAADGHIHLEFADSGRGIPPEKLARLFDFDFSSKENRVKMGVGLSTAYSIVQQHGGRIQAQSRVGLGSTFTVLLPLT